MNIFAMYGLTFLVLIRCAGKGMTKDMAEKSDSDCSAGALREEMRKDGTGGFELFQAGDAVIMSVFPFAS